MDEQTINSMKLVELKQKLKELNLRTTGKKATLQDRLLEHFGIELREAEEEDEELNESNNRNYNKNNNNKNKNDEQDYSEEEHSEEEYHEVDEETGCERKSKKQGDEYKRGKIFTLKDIRESLDCFTGNDQVEIEKWLQEFEENAIAVDWDDLQKFIYAKQLMKGAAKIFIRGKSGINNWRKLRKALLDEFGEKIHAIDIHKKLQNRRKKYNESYLEYLYSLIEISKTLNLDDKSIIEYFVDGISDTTSNKTILYDANNITELKDKIKTYEKIKKSNNSFNKNYNYKQANNITKKCTKCPQLSNHSTEECRKLNNLCYKCGKQGHKAFECQENSTLVEPKYQKINKKPYNNNNNSHNYNRKEDTNNNRQNLNINTKFCFKPINIFKQITIMNTTFTALFDTGSDLSLMVKSVYDKLKDIILFPLKIKINGVGQGILETLGYIMVKARMDGIEFIARFHIVNDEDINSQSLLGSDILEILEANISINGAVFWLKEQQKPLDDMLFEEILGTYEGHSENFALGHEFKALCQTNTLEENEIELGENTKHLNKITMNKLKNIIRNYKPNKTENVQIETKIILTDEIPIRQRPRRLTYQDQKIVEKQIAEWLQDGIIKESNSEYASPILLVAKKDGSKRLCCDYRKLNTKTIRDNFPMVIIDDVIAKLQNAKVFTTLDLKNGFFHVPVEEKSQKYTSFVTHHGQYEFLKTPFGITNAPATFCRYIAAVFHKYIQNGTIIVYMDDIVIPSQTIDENLEKLSIILNHASKYGLEINYKKCQYIQTKISFLGYIIEDSTIKPSKEKVKAIENYKEPTDLKSLQRFLGLTSFFRRFIEKYSYIAKPLTDLLSKNSKFKFNDEERMAFQQLTQALSNSPILKIFNPHAETEVHTDASMYGYGAALMQKDAEDQKWHPVEYMSRKTTKLEQNYHSYELEVLAIINALKKWKYYLLGIHIKIVTDCNAFTQTVKKSDVPARIARWIIFLQDYDYEIEHRAGSRLKHVDALSRVHSFLIQSSLKHRIIEAQDKDDWTSAIKKVLMKESYQDFYMKNDILYKDPYKECIVIPTIMEREIIEFAHRKGHVSIKKTMEIVEKDFFIRNLSEKTTNIVKSCVQCIISDAKAGKKEGMLNPIDKSDRPLETYHIDHVGPLEKTHKQYNHILVIVDAFSKFVWLYPTKSTGTNEVINILEKQAIIFGNPTRIITDRGSAFTSQLFGDYCKEQNVKHNLITTGVPRGNGQVERMHKIIISLLTKLCSEKPQNWYKHIGIIQQTLNSTKNRSTKTTPFKILTGIDMKVTGLHEIKQLLTDEQIKELEENREEIRELARENIKKIQIENCKNYNKKRKTETEYQVGDLVAIKRTQFGTGLKIKPKYLGPYKVTKKKRLGRYEVEKLDEGEGPKKTSTVAEYMKPWNS